MVAALIGRGLRRGELLALKLASIQRREDHWVIADLVGKGRQGRERVDGPSADVGEGDGRSVDDGGRHLGRHGLSRHRQAGSCPGATA